jgi:hypothetical protein
VKLILTAPIEFAFTDAVAASAVTVHVNEKVLTPPVTAPRATTGSPGLKSAPTALTTVPGPPEAGEAVIVGVASTKIGTKYVFEPSTNLMVRLPVVKVGLEELVLVTTTLPVRSPEPSVANVLVTTYLPVDTQFAPAVSQNSAVNPPDGTLLDQTEPVNARVTGLSV